MAMAVPLCAAPGTRPPVTILSAVQRCCSLLFWGASNNNKANTKQSPTSGFRLPLVLLLFFALSAIYVVQLGRDF